MTDTKQPIKVRRVIPEHDESQTEPHLDDTQAGDIPTNEAGKYAVTRTRKVEVPERGYYTVVRKNPWGLWSIVSHSSGGEIPEKLKQSYTSLEDATLSIYRYEGLNR